VRPDRERAFSKRGATAGVILVAIATVALGVAATGIAAVLQLAF
jgi:hypothetical protein